METFNFNFECKHCISYKSRRKEILNELFDGNITDNILSYTTCAFCHKMHEYEKEYATKPLKTIEHKQIHCILNHFDNGYKKLTNLNDKKNYLKDIIDKSYIRYKPLFKKFVNGTQYVRMIEKYKEFWLLDYEIKHLRVSYDFKNSDYRYRNQYELSISTIMLTIFYQYFKKQIGLYENYFNIGALWRYLSNIFD